MAGKKTGTKEWAEDNVNIQRGCEHGCRYCYARHNAVVRFKQCSAEQWAEPVINKKAVKAGRKKRYRITMFPSSHDITPANLADCLIVLEKLLAAGNFILVGSKPHWPCITTICERFEQYKPQILFRFTIGSKYDKVLSFWEPNAPIFEERTACLRYAYIKGYRTSVSCEPFLDDETLELYLDCKPYITDSFWIGLLRDFNSRVDQSAMSDVQIEKYIEPLKKLQMKEYCQELYSQLRFERLVRWKDSIRKILNKRSE